MKFSSVFDRTRISRSLVSILVLTLFQTFGGAVLSPAKVLSEAGAANSALIQSNLALDANATAGANDVPSEMTLVNAPPHTNSGVGYYTFNNTSVATASQKYAYKNLNFNDKANVSIFMWVYPTTSGVILSHSGQINPFTGYRLTTFNYTSAGKFEVGLYNNAPIYTASTSLTTPLNNWYYLGLTYDGATIRGYLNGKQFNTVAMSNWTTSAEDFFHVGSSQSGTCFSVGCSDANAASFRMGEFTVYRSTLSAADVYANYEATTNRFGPTIGSPANQSKYLNESATFSIPACTATTSGSATCNYGWQLSTDGGTSFANISGANSRSYSTPALTRSNNGNKYRVVVYDPGSGSPTSDALFSISSVATLSVSAPPESDTDTAVNTSGTQFFYAPAADSILPGVLSTVTMEAWVNPSATCDGNYFCSILASNNSFILDVYQGKVAYVIGSGSAWCDGGSVTYVANGFVPSGSWTHVAMVRNSANVKIYVNGGLVSNVTSSCSPTSLTALSSQQFGVGYRQAHDQYFYGSIDEVRIWTTDRSASIASDMHSNETSTSGLTNYWNFNEGTGGTAYNRVPAASASSDLISYGSTKDSASFWDADSISSASTSGAYSIRTFKRSYITASGGWKVPANVSKVTALVVAGGGGAGFNSGGGGSGGGVSYQGALSVSGNIRITVGMGGRGATSNGTATAGTSSTFGATNAAGGNGGVGPSGAGGTSVSGSGAGGAGSATSSAAGGNGGNGPSYSITGVSVNYAGGGGGGGWIANSVGGTGGSGGGAAGGGGGASSRTGANNNNGASGTPNTGGGGGGGSVSSATSGNGGSGIIIIRWITATAPIFTGPSSDTLTAGMVETFTASNNPNSPLTRNFRWQVSTDTGTTWANATTGTGLTSANYVTDILETSTSGTRYRYRVVVTDSDTAGLSIVETSTAIVFLTINPRITITGSSVSLTQKYGETQTVTYTIANGTGTRTTAASPNNRTGITWSSVSGSAATLAVGAGLGFGTYYETLTVTDSVTATTTQMFTISISKADTITVTATPSTTTYNASAITPGYVVSGLKNGETATATSNFLGINGTTYATTTTPPTNVGNYRFTPSDIVLSVGASLNNYQGVTYESATVTINKAFQAKLSIGQYDAFPGISSYPINVYGGTGLGSVTRTLVETGTANCALSGTLILTAVNVGTCTVRVVKDGGVNYFNETTTATIYWINFINRYTPSGPTTPTDLGLSGSTGFERRSYETFTVLSFANGSGTAVTSAVKGSVMRVIGTGFNSSDETTEVIIGFFSIPKSSLTFNTTNPLANYVEFTLPNSSDLDAGANDVAMKSRKGWAFAPGLLNVTG